MPLPTLTKTWEYDVNHAPITTIGELMFQMKNKLIGSGATSFTNPPTVVASSNATIAGLADNWASAADVTFQEPPGNLSWIVFDCSSVKPGLQMLWSCEDNPGGGAVQWEIFYSHSAGFTGLTTINARPTAVDSVPSYSGLSAAELDGFSTLAAHPARLHVAQSSDGEVLRIWAYTDGFTLGFWELTKPANPAADWTDPWLASNHWYKYNTGANQAQMSYTKMCLRGSPWFVVTRTKEKFAVFNYIAEAAQATSTEELFALGQDVPVELEGLFTWTLSSLGFIGWSSFVRGPAGAPVDMWQASYRIPNGTHLPSDGTNQFVVIDNVVIPWPTGEAQMAMS